jgi:hypothetical protein
LQVGYFDVEQLAGERGYLLDYFWQHVNAERDGINIRRCPSERPRN